MKKFTRRDWNTLVIACILGLGYAGYLIYRSQGGLDLPGLIAFGLLVFLVLAILSAVNRHFNLRQRP